jgi:O-antigen ligase
MNRLLFAIPIVLLPFSYYFPVSLVVAGMNLTNLLLLLLLCGLFFGRRDPAHLAVKGFLGAPMFFLFAVLVVGFVSAQWHDLSHVDDDLASLKNAIIFPPLYFIYRHCRQDLRGTRQLIVLVLVVAVCAGMQAVYQGFHFGFSTYNGTQRAVGPFGDIRQVNRAGLFFAMFLPMLAAVALQFHHRKLVRLAAIAGGLILIAAILFTYSRQAYLIALVAILILLLRRSLIAAVLAALLIFTCASLLPDSVIERVQETRQVEAGGSVELDSSTTSRFEIWQGARDMLRDHPMGVGLDRFQKQIGNYTNRPGVDAHNTFVLILTECGPLGLLAMLWLLWRMWLLARWLRRSAGPRPEASTLALGFTLTVVSMAMGNLYGSPFFQGLIMANFWILCGLMERYGMIKAHAAGIAHSTPEVPIPMTLRFPLVARALPGLALIRKPPLP